MMSMYLRAFVVGLLLFGSFTASLPVSASSDDLRLPLPRFVSLRAEEANMRTGPASNIRLNGPTGALVCHLR